MIEICKSVGNPLPIYQEDENNFSVIIPLKEPTPSIIFEKQEQKNIPTLTNRQHKILEVLNRGPLNRQQIIKQIKELLTDRTIQRDLASLKKMGLIQIS